MASIIDLIDNSDCTFLQNGNFTDSTSITPSLYSISRYQLSRLEGVSAIGPTATYCDSVEFSDPG